jgi:hypothetical protein
MRLLGTTTNIIGCLLLAGTGLTACDTEAAGVDSCRKIEYARCDAASHCSATFGAIDSSACRRFYRDHCLHGLPVPDPGLAKVNACVRDITELGECAAQGQDVSIETCIPDKSITWDAEITTVCSLISQPEKIVSCSFLNPTETDAGH